MNEPAISRRAGVTIWRQIEETLADDILNRRITERLPTETELSERFGVNRHTVRQAVKALAERGVIEVVHGKGTFVREDQIDYQLGRRNRLAHSVAKQRRVGKSQVLRATETTPRNEILQLLGLGPDEQALQIDSWDVIDDKVLAVCTQYFPLPRFAGFDVAYAELGKTHLALARFGVDSFTRKFSRITARLPSRTVAEQLRQPPSLPILYVETLYIDEQGRPIEFGISRFAGNMIQVVIEPDQEDS